MIKNKAILYPVVITLIVIVAFCIYKVIDTKDSDNTSSNTNTHSYKSISMEEAKLIFSTDGDYIILDVRRPDEFAEGHIPGAINIPNEEIGSAQLEALPGLDKTIYVYCRSGRRSKDAAAKLTYIGYTNIVECGGILDWTGTIEK